MKKKIFISLLLLLSVFVSKAGNTETVFVYGVDFTSAKVYSASESTEQFKNAFEGINLLLQNEADKYDFKDLFGGNCQLSLEMILKLTRENDFSNIMTSTKAIEPVNAVEKIKNYPLKEQTGTGFIVIATLLDKSANKGTYKVILFDIETREILREKEFTSKAGGFGLRNYWARPIHTLTKKFKFDKAK